MNSLILTLISWTSSKRNKNHLGMRNSFEQELPCLKRILSIHCYHCFTWTLKVKFSAFIRLLISQSCCSQNIPKYFFWPLKNILQKEFLTTAPIRAHWVCLGCWQLTRTICNLLWHLKAHCCPHLVATDACGWLPTGSGFTCWTHSLSTVGARMALPLQKTY